MLFVMLLVTYDKWDKLFSMIPSLETENVSAYYDTEARITFVTYRGELNAQVTDTYYQWLNRLIVALDGAVSRGVVFDFRAVTNFHKSNLIATNRNSRQTKRRHPNTHTHPVALITATMYQESMVRITTHLTGQEWRKQIVHTMDDAIAFIDSWHDHRAYI